MFLIDTNVVSALRRPERHLAPTLWLQQQRPSDIFLSVVTIGEIERGIAQQTPRNRDFHKLSDRLASGSEYLVLEDLSLAGWKKMWGRKTSNLGPGEFVRQLDYKFLWGGGEVLYAPRDYPSTQICSVCGQRGGKLDLSVIFWVCGVCGAEHDRDGNAALNLQGYGRELLGVSPRSPCETSSVEAVGDEVGTEVGSVDFSRIAEITVDF